MTEKYDVIIVGAGAAENDVETITLSYTFFKYIGGDQ